MTPPSWLANLTAYSLQVAALVAAAALLVGALRVRAPRVRLAIWQALLVACLALPLVQPWRPAPAPHLDAIVATEITAPANTIEPAAGAGSFEVPLIPVLAAILMAGALLRLTWLGLGLLRLARYRRDMTVLDPVPPAFADAVACAGARATIGVADGLSGPVTFGWRRPLVLLPPAVLTLDPALQQSVVCHELLHVRRRDWIWSVAEEVVCALAWFHPAIWWLVAQIDLAREQHVDAEVVRLTGSRKSYLEALLYLASPDRGADLVPASALLRRRHLAKRLLALAREVSMSRLRIVLSVAVLIVLLTLTAGAAAVSFPLVGQPLVEPPAAPLEAQEPVRVGGHIPPPRKIVDVRPVYPREAIEAHVQGVVILEVTIGLDGRVEDAKVVRSIPLLEQAALDAVRQWVFTPTLLNGTSVPVIMTVTVNFTLDDAGQAVQSVPSDASILKSPKKIVDVKPIYPEEAKRQGVAGVVILQTTIEESGLVSDVKVLRSIPMLDQAAIDAVRQWQFEPVPKRVTLTTTVRFSLDDKPAEFTFPQLRYPAEAVAEKVEGIVILDAVIGVSGKVVSVKLVDGPGLLAKSAIDAVRQWEFRTVTTPHTARIEIDYRLNDGKPSTGFRARLSPMNTPDRPMLEPENAQKPAPPKRTYFVAPVYPEAARAQKVEGVVVVEVLIGTNGYPADVKVIKGDDSLNGAALDAVRQWRWEPPAAPVVTTVTVRFVLDEQAEGAARPNLTDAKLKLVREVKPTYPPEAKEAKLSGSVELEIVVDENGCVASTRVLKGADAFHQAAIDAVRQWEFKAPGKAVKASVELFFTLR